MQIDVTLTPEEVAQAIVEYLERHRGIEADAEDAIVTADDEDFATVEVHIQADDDIDDDDLDDDDDDDDDLDDG